MFTTKICYYRNKNKRNLHANAIKCPASVDVVICKTSSRLLYNNNKIINYFMICYYA